MVAIEVADSRLRAASADLLAVVAAAGYILYDPQVGRLVVPMTQTAAPWPPVWTEPIAELGEALASAAASAVRKFADLGPTRRIRVVPTLTARLAPPATTTITGTP
jgi:hypothetical protein